MKTTTRAPTHCMVPRERPTRLIQRNSTDYGKVLRHHQAGGEWRVEKQRLRSDVLDAFAQAATEAGVPATDDFNRGSNEGVGYFEVNQRAGWRWNTAKAFLRPMCYARPNFELWTSAQVAKLVVEPHNGSGTMDAPLRCTGVQVWSGSEMVTATARNEVLLCAGAVGSPQILQLFRHRPEGSLARAWYSGRTGHTRRGCRFRRITCRFAPSSRSKTPRPLTPRPTACGAKPGSGWNMHSSAAAP